MYTDAQITSTLDAMIAGIDAPPVPLARIHLRMSASPACRPTAARYLRPALAAAAIVIGGVLVSSPGLVAALEDRYDAALRAIGLEAPPAVPHSITSSIHSRVTTLAGAQSKVPFTITAPSGLPGDVTTSKIVTAASGIYDDKTKTWHLGAPVITFEYRRSGGRSFFLVAEQSDPATKFAANAIYEPKDLPGGKVALIKHAHYAWRNGDQVMSASEDVGISAAEIAAIRDAMHGVALPGRDPQAMHARGEVKFFRILKP
ncbi:MAG: hypothetical protein ABR584_05720 [Candidatus Baltobacteraceae bacterium]